MGIKKTRAGIYVLAFDIHYPKYHKPSFNAMMDFMSKNKIAGFVFGGDQLDNAEISHFNKKKIIFREPGLYAKNTKGFEENILTPIEKVLSKDTEKIWIAGNHEGGWEHQLVEENPELAGTVEREILYDLEKRGWKYVPMGKGYEIGKLLVIHGESLTGSAHAKKAIDNYAQSVVYGHFHTVQSFTKVLPQNHKDKWIGQAMPALCTMNPVYMRNAPHSWVSGFGIVEVDEKGNFNVFPIIVTEGSFKFGGVVYGAKSKINKRVSKKRSA